MCKKSFFEAGDLIPVGCRYIFAKSWETLVGNGVDVYFPATMQPNDRFVDKFYRYTLRSAEGLSAEVLQSNRTKYGPLLESICGEPLRSIRSAFYGCRKMRVAPEIPETVTDMLFAFVDCKMLAKAPKIPSGVKSMGYAFDHCESMRSYAGSTDPDGDFSGYKIPDGLSNMMATFSGCRSMVEAPEIPAGVKNMRNTFFGCKSLLTAPAIPAGVTNMEGTFDGCEVLKTYAGSTAEDGNFSGYKIPDGVKVLSFAFGYCELMENAPWIPDSVTNMEGTFARCTALVKAPIIPANVKEMGNAILGSGTFYGCTDLSGTLICHANPDSYYGVLKGTQITAIEGSCSEETKAALLATK